MLLLTDNHLRNLIFILLKADGKSFACGGFDRIVSIYNTPREISSAYDNVSRISHKKSDILSASHEKNKQKQPPQHFLARDMLSTGCYKDGNDDNRFVNKSNQNNTIEDFAGEDVICDTVLESANESLTKVSIVVILCRMEVKHTY